MLRICFMAVPLAACVLGGGLLLDFRSDAHPVFAPFDDTQFAPITRFGPLITVETTTTGLTAPKRA